MSQSGATILIFDPAPRQLEAPEELLRSAGYSTLVADNADEACSALVQTPPELLLLPLHSDSVRVLILANAENIPVIFALENGMEESDVRRVYAMGGADYITLPPVDCRLLTRTANLLHIAEGQRAVARADQELYNFCMPVAHDLKAPFVTINMLLDLMKARLGDECTEPITGLIEDVECSSADVRQLIEKAYEKAVAGRRCGT